MDEISHIYIGICYGTAPMKIETGSYEGIYIVENTIFFNIACNENVLIEDEKHV